MRSLRSIKCVMVGDDKVGKTCLAISYTTNAFPGDYVPIVFDTYSANVMVDNTLVSVGIWETSRAGEDHDLRRPLLYPGTSVFLLCYSDRRSWENIRTKWHPEISHHCPGTPFLLVGLQRDANDPDDELISERVLETSPVTSPGYNKAGNRSWSSPTADVSHKPRLTGVMPIITFAE